MIAAQDIMERLKLLDVRPRWHGNGFVQLPLNETQRMHVWGLDTQPRPTNNARIHNHTWRMTSHVLWGVLEHRTYNVSKWHPSGEYNLWEIDGHAFRDPVQSDAELTGLYKLATGSVYDFPAGQFHESVAQHALTVITKTKSPTDADLPQTLAPYGEEPYDAHGDTMMSDEAMWMAIHTAIAFMDEWGRRQLMKVLLP